MFSFVIFYIYLTIQTRNLYVEELITFLYNCYYLSDLYPYFYMTIILKNINLVLSKHFQVDLLFQAFRVRKK